MIRLTDPDRIGPALADLRAMHGISRRQLARTVAEATGRDAQSVNAQLWAWDHGYRAPGLASLTPFLAALGYDLALTPREPS